MAQIGTVQSIEDKHLFVKVLREEACAHCNVCTTGINEGKECIIEALNKCDAQVGDIVEIDIQTDYFLRATAIMYGIPLIALLVGLLVSGPIIHGLGLPNPEVLTALVGLLCTGITYLLINRREKKKKNIEYLPIAHAKRSNET